MIDIRDCIEKSMIKDIHTHDLNSTEGIISIEPSQAGIIEKGRYYSVGIHPWHLTESFGDGIKIMERLVSRPEVVMVGECGLDGVCGAPEELQESAFKAQAALSERVEKPLLIHCVRRFPQLLALKREMAPRQKWIIHGFRGKPQLAAELIRHGFYLSVGERFNPASLEVIPRERLLVETDDSSLDIDTIAERVGVYLSASEFLKL